jgi:uracil-DNA glycosylase family 4
MRMTANHKVEPIPGRGPRPARLMGVGERPGKVEFEKGRVFSGPSGQELDYHYLPVLRKLGIEPGDIYLTNLVKDYREGNPEPEPWEVERDTPLLLEELKQVRPEIVVPMGGHSTRWFLPWMRERGWNMEYVWGLAYPEVSYARDGFYKAQGFTVFPINHPAAGLHDPDMQWQVREGWERLRRHLQGEDMTPPCTVEPVYKRLNGYGYSFEGRVALDSETNEQSVWGMSLSTGCAVGAINGVAIGLEESERIAQSLHPTKCRPIFHHALHDLTEMTRRMGFRFREDVYDDTMLLAYILQTYPQGLKPLAYRLLGLDMREYSDVVAPAQNELARKWMLGVLCADDHLGLLQHAPEETVFDPKAREWKTKKPWSPEKRIVRMLSDHYNKGGADFKARWGNVPRKQQEAVEAVAGSPFPLASLADIPEKDAIRYAGRDPFATRKVFDILMPEVKEKGLEKVYRMDLACYPIIRAMREGGILIDRPFFQRYRDHTVSRQDEVEEAIFDLVGARINPESTQQVAGLLFDRLRLRPTGKVKFLKSGQPSTKDKYLESWRKLHPVISLICEHRELDKKVGTFIDPVLQKSAADSRLYPDILMTRQYTGRFSGKDPNVLAFPADDFRQGFIAGPGNVWGCWDLVAIEFLWLAFVSKDDRLVEIFLKKLDPHTQTASRMFKVPYSDVDKDTQRYPCKRINYGTIYNISATGLYDQLQAMHLDYTVDDCQDMLDWWFNEYRGVKKYYAKVDAKARRDGYVEDYWGRRRMMEQVRCSLPYKREEALRAAENHGIQGGANGIFKLWLRGIWDNIKAPSAPVQPLIPAHDEFDAEVRAEAWAAVDPIIRELARETTPPEMAAMGLYVEADGGCGKNWAEAKG